MRDGWWVIPALALAAITALLVRLSGYLAGRRSERIHKIRQKRRDLAQKEKNQIVAVDQGRIIVAEKKTEESNLLNQQRSEREETKEDMANDPSADGSIGRLLGILRRRKD